MVYFAVCVNCIFTRCCFRDISCDAQNGVCNEANAAIHAAIRGAEGALRAAQGTLNGANRALDGARDAVNAARRSLNAANAVLDTARRVHAVGSRAATLITRFTLSGLLSIREISFDVALGDANGASFGVSVRASFLEAPETTLRVTINLRDLGGIARDLANHIGEGFSSLF